MASMEGVFETRARAGVAIVGMPDSDRKQLMDPIVVPGVLSYLVYGDAGEEVTGLNDIPEDQHPPLEIVYYAYHIMVGLGTMFIAIFAIASVLLWRGLLFESRGVLWALMLVLPFPYIANHAGWVVAEVGRQPWIVYGLRRSAEATSQNVTAGMTVFSLLGFMGLYALVGLLYLLLILRIVQAGPEHGSAHDPIGPSGAGDGLDDAHVAIGKGRS